MQADGRANLSRRDRRRGRREARRERAKQTRARRTLPPLFLLATTGEAASAAARRGTRRKTSRAQSRAWQLGGCEGVTRVEAEGPEPPTAFSHLDIGPRKRPDAAHERIACGIDPKLLVGVDRNLTPPTSIELAAEAAPLFLSR